MDDHIEGQRPLSELYRFRSTAELIDACRNDQLPPQMMINFHPQRWTDDSIPWIREWLMQNIKNVVKRGVILVRGKFSYYLSFRMNVRKRITLLLRNPLRRPQSQDNTRTLRY